MTHPFEKPGHPLPQLELPEFGCPARSLKKHSAFTMTFFSKTRKLDPRPFTASEQIKVLLRLAL